MSLLENLQMLRSMGISGDERKLQSLLRAADYSIQRAVNHYFESGFPDLSPPGHGRSSPPEIMEGVEAGGKSVGGTLSYGQRVLMAKAGRRALAHRLQHQPWRHYA
ncbi:unnamed protein product [Discosporangium mesarthrocarpum]